MIAGSKQLLFFFLIVSLLGGCSTSYIDKYGSRKSHDKKQTSVHNQQHIIPLDSNTFRFYQPFANVWNNTLDILLENYNLTIVDRRSGIITTEWDTFYLADKVYRNKVSLRLKKRSFNIVDVTVHNSIETWKSIGENKLQAAWLPADSGNKEVARIIQNLAISMNLPKPIIPGEAVASSRSNKLQ